MECGSYRGIKLLEHAMKVVERIFEHRIRQQVETDDMQFGFMKGKGTTDAIFTARALLSRYMPWSCVCVSVCLCLCLSQVGVLLKWLNVGTRKQRHTIAQGL